MHECVTEEQVREMATTYARENASDLTVEGVGALARGYHDGARAVLDLLPQRVAPSEDVRQIVAALASRLGHVETHWVPDDRATPMSTAEVLREFGAALAAHDAEVRAQALEDAAVIAESLDFGPAPAFSRPSAHRWGALQAAKRIRASAERGEA